MIDLRELKLSKHSEFIEEIEADSIPGRKGSEYEGEHLFINLLLSEAVDIFQPNSLVERLFNLLSSVLSVVSESPEKLDFKSVCISFYRKTGEYAGRTLRVSLPIMYVDPKGFEFALKAKIALISSDVPMIESWIEDMLVRTNHK
jgi:hypothetical protein